MKHAAACLSAAGPIEHRAWGRYRLGRGRVRRSHLTNRVSVLVRYDAVRYSAAFVEEYRETGLESLV